MDSCIGKLDLACRSAKARTGHLCSHESRIARQILRPSAIAGRCHEEHRKSDAHAVIDRKAECALACAWNEGRYFLGGPVGRYLQCRREGMAKKLSPRDRERSDVSVGADIGVTDTLAAGGEPDTDGLRVFEHVAMMLLAWDADGAGVDLSKFLHIRGCVVDRHAAQRRLRQASQHPFARGA